MDAVKLIAPRLQVWMDDGAEFDIQPDNRDMFPWDAYARKRGWPTDPKESFVPWSTFLAWRCLTREGSIPSDVKFEDFYEHRCVSVYPVGVTETDPTQPAVEAG